MQMLLSSYAVMQLRLSIVEFLDLLLLRSNSTTEVDEVRPAHLVINNGVMITNRIQNYCGHVY